MTELSFRERVFKTTEEENRRVILETLKPHPGATLLDLGCGNGSLTVRVAERVGATDVRGIELDKPWAAEARARGVQVTEADLTQKLPFDDGSIDVIHSNQVIEHVAQTDHFMREIRRLLPPAVTRSCRRTTSRAGTTSRRSCSASSRRRATCPTRRSIGNPANFVEGDAGAGLQMHLRDLHRPRARRARRAARARRARSSGRRASTRCRRGWRVSLCASTPSTARSSCPALRARAPVAVERELRGLLPGEAGGLLAAGGPQPLGELRVGRGAGGSPPAMSVDVARGRTAARRRPRPRAARSGPSRRRGRRAPSPRAPAARSPRRATGRRSSAASA